MEGCYHRWMRRTLVVAVAMLVFGCSETVVSPGEAPDVTPDCAEDRLVGGLCVGLPAASACRAEPWVDVDCANVLSADAGNYEAVIAGALAGDCVDLASGMYGAVNVPPGVSLMGRGAECVELAAATVDGGSNMVLRGMTVTSGGVHIFNASGVLVEQVRVRGAMQDGLELVDVEVTVRRSEILASKRYAISSFADNALVIEGVLVEANEGPGLWHQAADDCGELASREVRLKGVAFRGNHLVALALHRAIATLEAVEIVDTLVGENYQAGEGLAANCSSLHAMGLRSANNASRGVFVEGGMVELMAASTMPLEIAGNLIGIEVRSRGSDFEEFRLSGATVSGNDGIGLLFGSGTRAAVIDTSIAATTTIVLPVLSNGVSAGAEPVGDGLLWKSGAVVTLEAMSLSGSSRASMLIDGAVGEGSWLGNIDLSGGDEQKGIVHQNVDPDETKPALGDGVPTITTTSEEIYSVPDFTPPP